jgi:PAS domain S-box-containing protein
LEKPDTENQLFLETLTKKNRSITPAISQEYYPLLIDSIQDYAIFLLDTGGHVMSWNKGAECIKGYSPEEIIGNHFSIFYSEDDKRAGKPQRDLEEAADQGRIEDEAWRIRKDGKLFWANAVITALFDDKGKLQCYGKVTKDLTERKQAEERLKKAYDDMHMILDQTMQLNREMRDLSVKMAGREYIIRDLVNENKLLTLRLEMEADYRRPSD